MSIIKSFQKPGSKTIKQSGFSLLEVLITLVILAIGLLGLAGLQTTGLKQNQSAYLRSQAAQMSYDIADRMRANMSALSSYETTNPATATAATSGCTTAPCTKAQMASNDLYEWNKTLVDTLPSGTATISLSGGIYSISITWDDDHDGNSGNNPTFLLTFKP